MRFLALLLVAGCACNGPEETDDTDTCETLPGTCGFMSTGDTGCPTGFSCWGPSAFVCYRGNCNLPICLPPTTRIWTPDGERALWTLHPGEAVWTLDADGEPMVGKVVELGAMKAPSEHVVVHAVLSDGREVTGSPRHPTVDGRTLGELFAGDVLDGARVREVSLEPYDFARTFDLLPSGPTGAYRADGVWLGSTLGPM